MIEGDFTKVLEAPEDEGKYDAIVTLYFIDMAKDFLAFADVVHRVLKPGGIWINLGRTSSSFLFRIASSDLLALHFQH